MWNNTEGQTTISATITDATLAALGFITDPGQDGYHDTAADPPPLLAPLLVAMAGPV